MKAAILIYWLYVCDNVFSFFHLFSVADDIAGDVVAVANARIAALETEKANLKAQLEDKLGKQKRTVRFAESVESDDGFVQVDLV